MSAVVITSAVNPLARPALEALAARRPRRWVVVRRWRSGRATLTLHADQCPSIRRAEVANYVYGRSRTAAAAEASHAHGSETAVGRSHWGAECRHCGADQ